MIAVLREAATPPAGGHPHLREAPLVPGFGAVSVLRSGEYRFQIWSVDLDRCMLVNQLDGKHEPQVVAFSYERPLKPLHHAAPDSHFLADHKVAIGFDSLPAVVGAQKLNLGIRERNTLSAVSHNLQHAWRLEDLPPFAGVDMHKQVGWKQWKDELCPLAILPDPDGLIGREK
jgi:hypothetical protein